MPFQEQIVSEELAPAVVDNQHPVYAEHILDEEDGEPANAPRVNHPPTTLVEAEGGRWVVVPGDFVAPPIKPVGIVPVGFHFDEDHHATFLVDASIMDDPKLFGAFLTEVVKTYSANVKQWGDADAPPHQSESYRQVGIYTILDLKRLENSMKERAYLLQDHIPVQTIAITVGDSGIGKSPVEYELGICVAAGIPFLDIPTSQGRVLYLDFENNIDRMIIIAEAVAHHLGLKEVPSKFQMWSPALPTSADSIPANMFDRIRRFRPSLVIVDTLSAAFPDAEAKNENAAKLYGQCRTIMQETGCTFQFVHHRKKSSSPNDGSFAQEPASARDALKESRGASALVNGADARWIITRPQKADDELAFTIGGYLRGRGEHPTIHVTRVFDEEGNPIGHRRIGGVALLSENHREVFNTLPDEFRWRDLEKHFPGNRSKQLFRDACFGARVLEQGGGKYRKKQ